MNLERDDKFFSGPVDLLCGCWFGGEKARVKKEEGRGGKLGEEIRKLTESASRLFDC